MEKTKHPLLTIHIDGAARGNPGPAAFAYVITRDGQPDIEESDCLGEATNNVAEYTALVRALRRAAELAARRLVIYSDSELLVKQMNGEYRVKDPTLKVLFGQAKDLMKNFDAVSISHVPRERNSRADRLCNAALDGACGRTPAGSARRNTSATSIPTPRIMAVRDDAVACLRAAAAAWSRGNPKSPPPEDVWEQLWSVLEEHGIVRPARSA